MPLDVTGNSVVGNACCLIWTSWCQTSQPAIKTGCSLVVQTKLGSQQLKPFSVLHQIEQVGMYSCEGVRKLRGCGPQQPFFEAISQKNKTCSQATAVKNLDNQETTSQDTVSLQCPLRAGLCSVSRFLMLFEQAQ